MPLLTRALLALLLGACLLAVATRAHAKPPLEAEAFQLLGSGTPSVDGWFTVAVRLRSLSAAPVDGHVELIAEMPYASDTRRNVTRAPFALGGRDEALLELPTHGFYSVPPALKLRVLDPAGETLLETDVPDPVSTGPFLFDLSVPSRMVPALRARGVPVQTMPGSGRVDFPLLAVSSPRVHPKTGQPLLPESAVGYGPATVVVATSAQLARLSPPELEALGNWVLAGGTLAVTVTRPEDLRGPVLRALLGGEARGVAVPDTLKQERFFLIPADPSMQRPSAASPGFPRLDRQSAAPSAEVTNQLVHHTGANLRSSNWGSFASYGLGEVHLLAFDPAREPFVGDAWVQHSIIDLIRHAWLRDRHVALPHGRVALNEHTLDPVRRQLDPNERTRWTIAVSAVLLLLYAIAAGPLNFYFAARGGRPLRALLTLPIYAVVAMSLVILVGMLGRGIEGRSRRISFIEAGAGMARGAIVRYRGFFSSSADELTVRGSERRSVLDVAGDPGDTSGTLLIDRNGLRLERVQAKPWQTVVVREDSFMALGGGISIVAEGRGDVRVVNRAARDLIALVLKVPGKDAVYIPRLRDGQSVAASSGRTLSSHLGQAMPGGSPAPLSSNLFGTQADAHAPGIADTWEAVERVVRSGTEWWPVDVPVLLAELEGGETRRTDSGLKVDAERVLIRIVGYGGVP